MIAWMQGASILTSGGILSDETIICRARNWHRVFLLLVLKYVLYPRRPDDTGRAEAGIRGRRRRVHGENVANARVLHTASTGKGANAKLIVAV